MSSVRKHERMLPRFSLDRRVTVMVMMLTALVVGVVAAVGIPLELLPAGFDSPTLTVTTSWRDSPPREVLDKLAVPLEEELSTVRGLESVNSYSQRGRVEVYLTFKQGTDMDVSYREVRDRVLRAQPRMPEDIEPVQIRKQDTGSFPIMVVGVAIDEEVTDSYNLIQREIIRPLQRVNGVASVSAQGLQEKEVLIELDREKTSAAGLNIYQISQTLQDDNFSLASGNVRDGSQKLLLRSLSRYDDLKEVRDQFITPTVRISDIATVRYAEPEKFYRVRVNSKPAQAIQVYKEGQANTIEVGRALNEAFEVIEKNPKLAGSDVAVLFDQSKVIKQSIDTLISSGQVGAILAAVVLLFFLRRFRLTLVITLSIPLSMVIALTAMYFADESLNILSLLGLIISVGLLVDNSVVVAENIVRLYRDGASRRDACIEGTAEIALAVIMATLTTIVVFLPVALVEGRGQFFLLRLALPLTVSLAASLFVALIFIPLCVYVTLSPAGRGTSPTVERVHRAMDSSIGAVYRGTIDRLNRTYNRLLAFFLNHRFDLIFVVIVVFAATLGAGSGIDVVDVSDEDQKSFNLGISMPSNFSLEDAEAYFSTVEDELAEIRTELGLEGYFIFHASNFGRVQGWFPGRDDLSKAEVTEMVVERLPKRPGVEIFSGQEDRGDQADKVTEHVVAINGENPEVLDRLAEQIEDLGRGVDGVVGVKQFSDQTPNEVAILVDRARVGRAGLNPSIIAGAVAVGLRGQPLPKMSWEGKIVPMRIRFIEADREGLDELADFAVPTPNGNVALASVTEPRFISSSKGIFRENKRMSRRVTFDLTEEDGEETKKRLEALFSDLNLPEGVRLGARSAQNRFDDEVASLRFAALVSVVFVYLLMGFLFESFILPLSIIFTIPLATLGVIWVHAIAQRDLDFLGFIGVILLIGVVVNNGIVFVDYVNRARDAGVARTEAVLLAARRRFRPIMMTAGSTIFGMIPLTIGQSTGIGISYRSFGLALIGGMVTATALTLLVVPVLYTLLDDARDSVGRAIRRARGH